jgi:hypothetical protein
MSRAEAILGVYLALLAMVVVVMVANRVTVGAFSAPRLGAASRTLEISACCAGAVPPTRLARASYWR